MGTGAPKVPISSLRRYPHLYEINACGFVCRLSDKYSRPLTLMTTPDEEWQALARLGFDIIWLMGVWQRSPSSRQEALRHPELRTEYDHALPGWTEEDINGSPYAIQAYELSPLLGKPEGLPVLKEKLNRMGLRLMLDFVPNHLAIDHPWIWEYPERFIHRDSVETVHPGWFFLPETSRYIARSRYFAHGRDPNFPPWTDTVQVNFFSPDLRQALTGELLKISEASDGVRCDMAMLALNDVFGRVWGKYTDYPRPRAEFWSEAIGRVKKERPDFLFLAEAYWDTERQLQQLGFDYTYDKTLYDRLRYSTNGDIRAHLRDRSYQEHSVHFIENHDEQRAMTAFGKERSLAAAAVMSTVPGVRLFYDGQFDGHKVRVPTQFCRQPQEPSDAEIRLFYENLLAACGLPHFHNGEWEMLEFAQSSQSNNSHPNVLCWTWRLGGSYKIVAVNYSHEEAAGWLELPAESLEKTPLRDDLTGATQTYNIKRLERQSLYLELKPWEARILDYSPAT